MNKTLIVLLFVLLVCNAYLKADEKQIEIQWLGHSAFKITSLTGKKILIDPFLTKNPKTPPKFKQFANYQDIDLILVTHAHEDHIGDAIELASKYNIPVYSPPGLSDTLVSLDLLPPSLAPRFNKGGSIYPLAADIKITMTHAEHSSEFKYINPDTKKTEMRLGGEPVGFIIRLENKFTLYHMGDTGIFGDMQLIANYYRPDLLLLPIGGHYVMDPADAAYVVKEYFNSNYLVPMHYGTSPELSGNVADLNAALKGSSIKVFDMVPGDIIKF